jgi:hypothetical protein
VAYWSSCSAGRNVWIILGFCGIVTGHLQ